MILKILKKNKINKSLINKISKLKNQEWKYGVKANIRWFQEKIEEDDIHFILFNQNKIIAYNCMRKKIFLTKKKIKNTLYIFDSLVVCKKYRNKGLGKFISIASLFFLNKFKLKSFLLCKKKNLQFYKSIGWKFYKDLRIKLTNHSSNNLKMFYNFSKPLNIKEIIF